VAWPRFEMSPFIAMMSRVTSHLGFGLTYASTFMHPFYTARLLNSLDHVTNGRIAFNVITSQRRADYANYGYDELVDHNERYDRLEEFIDVCRALWSSVDADAFVWDRKSGTVADPRKVRPINHVGKFFKVKGPLSVVPSPQGQPVIIQAGGSPRGTRAAAHVADHVFGLTKSIPLMVQQRTDLDRALVDEGRDPDAVGILWSSRAMVGETEAEAHAMRESMIADVPLEAVGVWLSHNTGYDMSQLPSRFSLAELQQRIVAANASPVGFVHLLAKKYGENTEISREEFFEHSLPTGWKRCSRPPAAAAASCCRFPRQPHARCCRTSSTISYRSCNDGTATAPRTRARHCAKTCPPELRPGAVIKRLGIGAPSSRLLLPASRTT
jgi:alkanesulfonate monooxygenase SsuD/methylene tetrahydromethanopterin reductase-like flavin-dependent oxidoreductase (luciferase family)